MADDENGRMSDHTCSELPSMCVTFPGPFEHHEVVVNGWKVPFLEAHMQGEDRVLLVIDRRLGGEFSVEEAERVIPFVADSISVALGYGCHPRLESDELQRVEPHVRPRRLTALAAVSAEGTD
jgi:hypothetical protein